MKLSIITTIYQAEKDLPRLFDSMMSNESQELEFFLIDNGSTDRSAEICREYAAKDRRFHIHTLKDNIGYIRARNLGLDIVKADYVGFCDSDDFVEAGAYDIVIEKLKQSGCDLLIGGWHTISGDSVATYFPPFEFRTYSGKEEMETILPQFFGRYEGHRELDGFMWKQFFRLSIIKTNRLSFRESLKPYEDILFNAQYIKLCNIVTITDTVIYNYIVNPESITVKIVTHFRIKEEAERISELISALRVEAKCEQCLIATANQGLIFFTTMISISSQIKKSSFEISAEISESLSPDFIHFILHKSRPQKISYKFIKQCLKKRMLRFIIWLLKLKIYIK